MFLFCIMRSSNHVYSMYIKWHQTNTSIVPILELRLLCVHHLSWRVLEAKAMGLACKMQLALAFPNCGKLNFGG